MARIIDERAFLRTSTLSPCPYNSHLTQSCSCGQRSLPPDSPSRRQLSIQSKGRFGGKKPELMQLSLSCLYTDRFAAALHAECTPSPFNLSFPLLRCRGQSGSRVNTRVGTVVPPGALFPHRILHQVPSTRGSSPTSACFHRTYQVPCVI